MRADEDPDLHTISVIIPTWNRARMLPRALDSVISQSRPADEIIVVDDGSSDNTVPLLQQHYPGVTLLRQAHQGVSAARNRGITTASGEWLALLDSDDAWHRQKLARQVACLKDNPGYQVIHTNEQWIRHGRPLRQSARHRKQGGWLFQHCLPRCVISPSAILLHRAVFDRVGLFDEALVVCEDYDMWLRLCARLPVLYLEAPLTIKYGGHADQLSGQYRGMDKYRIMALAKILAEDILNAGDTAAAISALHYKINLYLKGAKKHNNTDYVRECEALLRRFA